MTYSELSKLRLLTIVQESIKLGGSDHEPKVVEQKVAFTGAHNTFMEWIVGNLSDGATVAMGTYNNSPTITSKQNVTHVGEVLTILYVKEDPNGVMVKKFLGYYAKPY